MKLRFIVSCFICLLASPLCTATPARAQWHGGYEAPGFYGGSPYAAIEWNGGQVFGGAFLGAHDTRSPGVIGWDGTSFFRLGDGIDARQYDSSVSIGVEDLLEHGDILIAAGDFAYSGNRWVGCVARFENDEWRSVGGGLEGTVWDLVRFEGKIVAIGPFVGVGDDAAAAGIAMFDGVRWQPMGERPPHASALAVHEGVLYAGFSRWTGSAWEPIAACNAPVLAMISTPEGLVIGGRFSLLDGQDVRGIVRYDGAICTPLGSGNVLCETIPGFDSWRWSESIVDFGYRDGHLLALGSFASDCLVSIPYYAGGYYDGFSFGLARFDGSEWREIGSSGELLARMRPDRHEFDEARHRAAGALVSDGEDLLVLGDFSSVGSWLAAGVVQRTATDTWQPICMGRGRLRPPSAIALREIQLLVADGRHGIQHLTDSGLRIPDGKTRIYDLQPTPNALIAIGKNYTEGCVGPWWHAYLAPVEESLGPQFATWGYYDSQSRSGVYWPERGFVILREPFSEWGYYEYSGVDLELYDLDSGMQSSATRLLEIEGQVEPCPTTQSLAAPPIVHGNHVVSAVGNRVVRWDGSAASDPYGWPAPAGLDTLGTAVFDGPITAMGSARGRLYAAGEFTRYGDEPIAYLAEWTGESWVAPDNGSPNGPVYAMATSPADDLWLGGNFTAVGNAASSHLALRRDDLWGPFPDGPNGSVMDFAFDDEGIWISGDFTRVGGIDSHYLARWTGDVTSLAVADSGDELEPEPETDGARPRRLELLAPHPNPFNPRVEIAFRVPRDMRVRLEVIDVAGRLVRTLLEAEKPAGTHRALWTGIDDAGRPVASGSYIFRLNGKAHSDTRKVTLLR